MSVLLLKSSLQQYFLLAFVAVTLAACTRCDPEIALGKWHTSVQFDSIGISFLPDIEITRSEIRMLTPSGELSQIKPTLPLDAIRATKETITLHTVIKGVRVAIVCAIESKDRLVVTIPVFGPVAFTRS
jgi:hypothetical protein